MPLRFLVFASFGWVAWLLPLAPLWAQTGLRGTTFDGAGQPLPFATVYVAGTSQGTTSNAVGRYALHLPPGSYEVVFQYVGYGAHTERVTVADGQWTERNVRLADQVVALREVVVDVRAEDPAYAIMRQAIARRKFFRREVAAYTGKTYVKGVGRLEKYPRVPFIRGKLKEAGLDTGVVFLTESVAEVSFAQPDSYRERVVALKVTGSDELTPLNRTTRLNFYEPLVFRAVSPLSDQAFAHYRFELLGTFRAQGTEVNKIRVTPRRRNARAFQGTIYVVEDRWNLHSVDLTLPDPTMTHRFRQVFAPVQDGIWMPLNHQLSTEGYALVLDLIRVDFSFRYTAVQSEYLLTPDPDRFSYLPRAADVAAVITPAEADALAVDADTLATAPTERRLSPAQALQAARAVQKLQREAEREARTEAATAAPRPAADLTLLLDTLATRRDSTFWSGYRPVPLTTPELKGYRVQDSLQARRDDPAFRDSVEAAGNRWRPVRLLTGYRFHRRGRPWTYTLDGLIDGAQFNAVEGYVLAPGGAVSYAAPGSGQPVLTLGGQVRHGFASGQTLARGHLLYEYRPQQPASLRLEGGHYVTQFNPAEPIAPVVNTLLTLLRERNYLRLYEQQYVQATYRAEVHNGLYLTLAGGWADRRPRVNRATYRLVDVPGRSYLSNQPRSVELGDVQPARHQAFTAALDLQYTPGQRYYLRQGRKRVVASGHPTFGLHYRRGLPLGDGDTDYQLAVLRAEQRLKRGRWGQTRYAVRGGGFLTAAAVPFADFVHFMGNQTPLLRRDEVNNFHLLPYYERSTRRRFVEGHAEHRFDRLVLARLPLVGLLDWHEVAFVNYLHTPAAGHYTEVGVGIDGLFQLFRVDVAAAFGETGGRQLGVRVGMTPGVR